MGLTVSSLCNPDDLVPGKRLVDGQTNIVQLIPQTSVTGLTALAGGGATGAPVLSLGMNEVDTVVTAADSFQLPAAISGATVTVYNNASSTDAMTLWPDPANPNNAASAADVIVNAAGTTVTSISVTHNTVALFRCFTAGTWKATI